MKTIPHVLLVDDDSVDVMNVKKAFEKNHIPYPLHVANQGEIALDMLRGTNGMEKLNPTPSFILLDINMPRMNGIEFLQELRKDDALRMIYVFILTTSDEDSDMFEAFNLNVAGYMLKPVSFTKFIETIETVRQYWDVIEKPVLS